MNHSSNHLRQNILTEQWVIFAPDRAKRSQHRDSSKKQTFETLSEKDDQCPFCVGNEKMLPSVTWELKDHSGNSWFTRVVPNKYPALINTESIKGGNTGPYLTTSAFGTHEVIIESPFHNHDIPVMSTTQVTHILETYADRYRAILKTFKDIINIIIFRNHGPTSGTSLIHPHSQLIGTPIIPKYIYEKEIIAKKYHEKNSRCSLCDIIEYERHDGKRYFYENTSFGVLVPFASQVPFEVWIIPKRHCADFGEINPREIADLAHILKIVLTAYYNELDDPDYNYIIHSCSRRKEHSDYLHWYIQLLPKLTTPAGFEIGSGIHINPSLPEDNAEILKDHIGSYATTG